MLILDGERQIQPDLPPVGDAIGEFRRPVDGMVGDEASRKRRILQPDGGIVEVLLDGELAHRGDAGVVNLDFVGGLGRLPQRDRDGRCGQQAEAASEVASETMLRHRARPLQ